MFTGAWRLPLVSFWMNLQQKYIIGLPKLTKLHENEIIVTTIS
jgi:hypothetical protein